MRAPGLLALLLGLGLGLALSVPPPVATDCSSLGPSQRLAFSPAARTRWLAPRVRAPGPLDPLYGMVRRFLSVVQLNPFPSELVKALLNEPSSLKVDEVVRYEAGYVVCAVTAGLYLVAVPTTGLCFCCCRCRRRCGGRVKTEHKAMACERGTLMAFLLLTTIILLAGVVCAFVTNQRTHEQMGPSVEAVPETLRSLRGLVSDVPGELEAVAKQFSVPQEQVLKELDGIGESIGPTIHSQLRSTMYSVLASVHSLGQALQVSMDQLQALNSTLVELQEGQQQLGLALEKHRDRLLTLLQQPGCGKDCTDTQDRARALELAADFTQVPPVDNVLHRLKGVPEANFSNMVQEENATFNSLPILVAMQMELVIKDLKEAVAQKPEGMGTLAEAFPELEAAPRWSRALEELEENSRPYLQEAQRYETYRWTVGCVLCSVVLLVVACNLLGLSLGIWGLSAREDPSQSEAKGEAGARFLMVGVGFSFVFAAPLILLVFLTFLVGGNVQTLVCRSWESGELYQFADTPGNLPPSLNLSHLLGMRKNVSVLLTYQQCREGAALWKVLQLDDSYNLEKHLDISQVGEHSRRLPPPALFLVLSPLQPTLGSSAWAPPEGASFCGCLGKCLKCGQGPQHSPLVASPVCPQIQRPVVKTDLEQLAQELQGLAQAQGNSSLGQQLRMEARGLRDLYQEKVVPRQNLVAELNLSVRALESAAPRLQLQTADVLSHVADLERELPARAARILMNESACFLSRELSYFSQYLAWVREEVTQRIATCQPLSAALDNGRVILCDMVADPWNAFWFCLAWCTFFLIPSIVFAVKTSKYFRPIRKRLSSTSSEETQLFHIPRVTSLKL
uniref:prominin-2 n=1 Tax=Ictidomys tridecemlineatus TaxID=43179 RepID=UPI001A9DC3C4|nr:prominin-2 [Ictidomys tridecemlineatus]